MPQLLLVFLCIQVTGITIARYLAKPWLIEGLQGDKGKSPCEELTDLNSYQRGLCNQQRETRSKLITAASMAHQQCRTEFQYNPWNCSVNNVLSLNAMTKETSYVTAIGSAAIVHQIAQACADGNIRSCGCGVNNEYSSACDDNIRYGILFARQYLDSPQNTHSPPGISVHRTKEELIRSAVNIHNNNAGRQMVDMTARTKCTCYGMSGSCTTYICYKQVAPFQEIGRQLYKRYKEAVKVRSVFSPTKSTKLAFIDESPDFCTRNRTLGISGTEGRPCLPQPDNTTIPTHLSETCSSLCCGRGYTAQRIEETIPCKCQFQWCCEVVCQNCTNVYYTYNCNS
ncbi:protein Wnt-5-like isoform X2 [Bolinopsis microptera]|uniref:protein Wnt-5-like isoform X2 n=1 Tax=Bolinopsis microptera TaxID=2820187 RepID=UPI003078FA5C